MDIESARNAPETNDKNEVKNQDRQQQKRQVEKIVLKIGGSFGGYTTYYFIFTTDGAELSQTHGVGGNSQISKKVYSVREAASLRERFEAIHTDSWNSDYPNPWVCDGEQWSLIVCYSDGFSKSSSGSNAYPDNWNEILGFFGIDHEG